VVQAKGLLLAAEGVANGEIARRCETTPDTVRRWRARFAEAGVEGVGVIAPGRGRKPSVPAAVVEAIVHDTLHARPEDGSTHWTTRSMADRYGVSNDMVARIWKARNLKPWQVDTFKLSNDPRFEEKLVDIVGLYLNPPERAVVLCVDEKSQTQAVDRTQPSLPMKPGRASPPATASRQAPTTTSPNRSPSGSCWHGCECDFEATPQWKRPSCVTAPSPLTCAPGGRAWSTARST